MECKNPCRFDKDDGTLCDSCESNLEAAVIQSLLNMGTPEKALCGSCGYWYSYPNFLRHPCVINANS